MSVHSIILYGGATILLQALFLPLVAAQAGGTVSSGFPKPPIFPTGVDSNDKSTVTLTGTDTVSDFTEIRIISDVTGAKTVVGVWTPNSQPSDSTALPVTLEGDILKLIKKTKNTSETDWR